MKILAVRGANLASLAGEFEIDLARGALAGAGVFAIVGPTGAGKSTLLDAICVALFDRTPRLANRSTVVVGRGAEDPAALGAQDVRTILRRGAAAGYAEVDFESGDLRRYRARWSVRRARDRSDGNLQAQQITLCALGRGGAVDERLGGTRTETLDAIHDRLGLSFDQFRRSALLAQGEFAAFLRADGRDRSELLERMTGTEIYSRLSVAAHVRAAAADQLAREGRAALGAIAVLDPEARAAAEAEAAAASAAVREARAHEREIAAIARWVAEGVARGAERDAAVAAAAAAAAHIADAAAAREELALRRRAERLRGPWETSRDLARRIERERADLAVTASAAASSRGRLAELQAQRAAIADLAAPIRAARLAAGVVERVPIRAGLSATTSGAAKSGAAVSGAAVSGAAVSGAAVSGAAVSGAAVSGAAVSGAAVSGAAVSGAAVSGAAVSGAAVSGAAVSGAAVSGAAVSGAAVSGAAVSSSAGEVSAAALLDARESARWVGERAGLAVEVTGWGDLDVRFAQRAEVAEQIARLAGGERGLVEQRAQLARTREARVVDKQHAAARLAELAAQAAQLKQRRGLSLDDARRAEDLAREACADAERLVAIAAGAREAAHVADELARQLAEHEVAIAADARHRADAEARRARAEIVREERELAVAELRRAAGYAHARAELVDGEPCPLCGAEAHPWRERGALVDVVAAAEAKLGEARGEVDRAAATLAAIAARGPAHLRERERLAAHHATATASVTAAGPAWTEQLATLRELGFERDPASPAAARLAAGREVLARRRFEEARNAREQVAAGIKSTADAQAALAIAQHGHDHLAAGVADLDQRLAELAAALERAALERAGRAARHVELTAELGGAISRWRAALPATDEPWLARLAVGLTDPNARGATEPGVRGADADTRGIADGSDIRGTAGGSDIRGTAGGSDIRGTAEESDIRGTAGESDIRGTAEESDIRGTAGESDIHGANDIDDGDIDRADVRGVDRADTRGVDGDGGGARENAAGFDRARIAMGELAAAWRVHCDRVVDADAVLAVAVAHLDREFAALERGIAEQVARHGEGARRLAELEAEHAAARDALAVAVTSGGFGLLTDRIVALLGEPAGRSEALAEELAATDRELARATSVVDERERRLADHLATRPPIAATPSRSTSLPSMAGPAPAVAPSRSTSLPSTAGPAPAIGAGPTAEAEGSPAMDVAAARDRPRLDESLSPASAARWVELAGVAEARAIALDEARSRLAAMLEADAAARARREAAEAGLCEAERAAEVDRVLGEVIGSHDGKVFRSFAQSLTLDSLLAVANSHLDELAPRYQLERVPRHDLELQVIDRDLGSEVRSVQSLSGGESFLASLALALGLSSMSAHDVRVRTLLIDEGFGSLDPVTLDGALAVLDRLQATGCQVGVISHVPALVERVGAHVRVSPRGGGRSEVVVA